MSHLSTMLQSIAEESPERAAAASAVEALALAAVDITTVIRQSNSNVALSAVCGSANKDGDEQKALDVLLSSMSRLV